MSLSRLGMGRFWQQMNVRNRARHWSIFTHRQRLRRRGALNDEVGASDEDGHNENSNRNGSSNINSNDDADGDEQDLSSDDEVARPVDLLVEAEALMDGGGD